MTKTAHETLERRLQAQIALIKDAITSTRQDKLHDIRPLEKEVSDLCAAIVELPPGAAQDLETSMAELISGLDELAMEIRAYQDRLNISGSKQ